MERNVLKKLNFRKLTAGLIPLFVLAHFGHHLLTALPIPLLPMIRTEFNLDYTQSGFVISAFTLAYGVGQLPGGWLADRIGGRILMTVGICGVALFGLLVGISQTYIMVVISMILMGAAGGGYHPAATPLLTSTIEPKKRGRALGFHLIGGSGSYFLSPIIAAAIATAWGWRSPFIVLATVAFAFGVAFFIILGRIKGQKTDTFKSNRLEMKKTVDSGRSRRLIPFLILVVLIQATYHSVLAFIPLFLVDHFNVSAGAAAAMLSLIYLAGLWAGIAGGYLSDRIGRIPMIIALCFLLGPAILFLNIAPYGIGIGALLTVLGIITFGRMPISEAFIIDNTSEHNRSTIMGTYYFGNQEGTGVLTAVVGYLIDKFGFQYTFSIAGFTVMALVLLYVVWLWSTRKQVSKTNYG